MVAKHPRSEAEGGSWNSTIQYTAYGEIRLTEGVTPTKYRYTGQLAQAELGLDYYVALWYDPVTGHFTSADSIIPEPGKASAFDRYGYVSNNPIRYSDPSGNKPCDEEFGCEKRGKKKKIVDPPKLLESLCKIGDECQTQNPSILHYYQPASSSTHTPKFLVKPGPTNTPTPKTEIQQYVPSSEPVPWEINPDEPDYYAITISIASFTGVYTFDRYRNLYIGGGPSLGKGLPIGFSVAEGSFIKGITASERSIQESQDGLGINTNGAAIIGFGKNNPLTGNGLPANENIIFGTPQIGVSLIFNVLVVDNKTYGY